MKSILIGAIAVAATMWSAAPASAADLAETTTAPLWGGFYVGGQIGYRFANVKRTAPIVPVGGQTSNTISFSPDGLVGGGRIGFDALLDDRFVLGAVADFDWGRGSDDFRPSFPAVENATVHVRRRWDASARLRAGALLTDNVLLYATGGVAFARAELKAQAVGGPSLASWSRTRTGWTIGGGGEVALDAHWRVLIEYRHADYGKARFNWNGFFGDASVKSRTDTILTGVNYRF